MYRIGNATWGSGLFSTISSYISNPIAIGTDIITTRHIIKRWATKKASGGSVNGRDSNPKYLGVKKGDGEAVRPGQIIVKQRGQKFHCGIGVKFGKDYTIHAVYPGRVRFSTDDLRKKYVSIDSFGLRPPSIKEIKRVGLQSFLPQIELEVHKYRQAKHFKLSGGMLGRTGVSEEEEKKLKAAAMAKVKM